MTSMHPTTLEDRLGFFVAAQLHGYPLLFVPNAERASARPSPVHRRGARRHLAGLVRTVAGRRRPSVVEPAPCATC